MGRRSESAGLDRGFEVAGVPDRTCGSDETGNAP